MLDNQLYPLQVKIELFEGPLDLLLQLIRKKKLDIQTVKLSELCLPFLEYVKEAKKIQLDNLGQFLYIASSLIVIKTRSLLPIAASEDEQEDTQEDLRRQLLEYDNIKKMSNLLLSKPWLDYDIFARNITIPQNALKQAHENIEINIPDLFESYKTILIQLEKSPPEFDLPSFQVNSQDVFEKILQNFQAKQFFNLKELFSLFYILQEKIIAFVLVLEICRLHWIRIEQKKFLGDILFYPNQNFVYANKKDLFFA